MLELKARMAEAPPDVFHSVVASLLSLASIMGARRLCSIELSGCLLKDELPKRAATMSTFTMLAVS